MTSAIPFLTLIRQELYRFIRLIRQTILPPILTTTLFILIFGFSLGSRIQEIHGFPYIIYIIPGLAAMGVINSSFANTSTSLFMAKFDRSLENLLATPLSPLELVLAYVMGGLTRGLIVGGLILAMALLLLKQPLAHIGITLFFFVTLSVIFGCWGIIASIRAKTWDNMATLENFIITPLVYLGGVFYSIDLLPQPWNALSHFNPMFYMVSGVRHGVLGTSDNPLWLSMAVTAALALGLFSVCVYLFKIGYRLVR